MIHLTPPVIRPPAEADALILQATIGCSHNRCRFCVTYKQKTYRHRLPRLFNEIDWASTRYPQTTKVFLGDGDALSLSCADLMSILKRLKGAFPNLKRVSAYASPLNFRHKTLQQLTELKQSGLSLVYVGLESGDDQVLHRIGKGMSSQALADLCRKPGEAGLKMSATVVLGLCGVAFSEQHSEHTARIINYVQPRFLSALTLMTPQGERAYRKQIQLESWRPLTPRESLQELRTLISNITADKIIFRSNHPSNYLSLAGTLQKGKQTLLSTIDDAIVNGTALRPEHSRGL